MPHLGPIYNCIHQQECSPLALFALVHSRTNSPLEALLQMFTHANTPLRLKCDHSNVWLVVYSSKSVFERSAAEIDVGKDSRWAGTHYTVVHVAALLFPGFIWPDIEFICRWCRVMVVAGMGVSLCLNRVERMLVGVRFLTTCAESATSSPRWNITVIVDADSLDLVVERTRNGKHDRENMLHRDSHTAGVLSVICTTVFIMGCLLYMPHRISAA